MLTIILLILCGIILFVIGVFVVQSWEYEELGILSCIIGTLLFMSGIVASLTLINRETRWNYTIQQYKNLKAIVECYDNTDKDRIEAITLRNDILQMNNLISEHKVKSQSPWVDMWYSEEIGNLEPIKVSHVNELSER